MTTQRWAKSITPDWNFGYPVTAHLKVASGQFTYADKLQLIKSASAEFADRVHATLQPKNGEEYVHVIAIGAHEWYGPNRKGDTFTDAVCKKYHKTFEKHARWYRDHIHHNPAKSYGAVKVAHYDDKRKRVDLVVALNATERAAKKNGGLVADKELDLLFNGQPIPVSMSCLVSHDICSGCGHRAKSEMDRCGPQKCVKYGGCRTNLGKTFADGHTLCVFNPDPVFFDISYVQVPADRIAYSLGVLKQPQLVGEKTASLGPDENLYKTTRGSKEWRENYAKSAGFRPPEYDLLRDLAWRERRTDVYQNPLWPIFTYRMRKHADFEVLEPHSFLSATHRAECLLPPDLFFAKIYPCIKRAQHLSSPYVDVSRAFSALLSDKNVDNLLVENPYDVCVQPNTHDANTVTKIASMFSLAPDVVQRRQAQALIKGASGMTKVASLAQDAELAKEYGLYVLAFLKQTDYTKNVDAAICNGQTWYLQ